MYNQKKSHLGLLISPNPTKSNRIDQLMEREQTKPDQAKVSLDQDWTRNTGIKPRPTELDP